MKWTMNAPTEPGYYWIWEYPEEENIPEIVLVQFDYLGDLEVCIIGSEISWLLDHNNLDKTYRWAGPIPEPEKNE